jgi:predicted lipoprotein
MDELREAARVLAEEAQHITSQIEAFGAPPSSAQLQALQEAVDRVQQGLNRLQTGLDSWTEETAEV